MVRGFSSAILLYFSRSTGLLISPLSPTRYMRRDSAPSGFSAIIMRASGWVFLIKALAAESGLSMLLRDFGRVSVSSPGAAL